MRDPNRLFKIYDIVYECHRHYCPDWRMGQLFFNFMDWVKNKNKNFFFIEDDDFIELFSQFKKEVFENN